MLPMHTKKADNYLSAYDDELLEYFESECKKRELDKKNVFSKNTIRSAYAELTDECESYEMKHARITKIMNDLDGYYSRVLLRKNLLGSQKPYPKMCFYVDWSECSIKCKYYLKNVSEGCYILLITSDTVILNFSVHNFEKDKKILRELNDLAVLECRKFEGYPIRKL